MEKTIASITKPKDEELKERLSAAREKLATLQIKVKEAKLPVLVLFEGFGAAGKGGVLSKIIKNMDPRFFHVETMDQPEPTELRKPFLYRYFKRIPENGQFTFMDGGWMEEIVRDRVHEQLDEEAFGKKIRSIKRFERTLSDNGYTILKFFFYIDENEQKKRMEELLADENTAWRVSEEDLWQNKKHKKCSEVYQTYMEQTNQSYAPWYAIDAKSKKWAELQILERINQNIETALANSGRAVPILPNLFPLSPIPKLADVDLNKELTEEEYQEKLERSKQSDVDVRDFFDDEELDRILSDNEFFNGRVADLSKMQRYEKLKLAAQWMNDHSMEVVCVDIDKPSQSRPNVVVSMELRRLSSLRGRELKIFSAMNALADTVFLSGLKDEAIRFSFGIESLWQ